jgi:hypothetical protein
MIFIELRSGAIL